MKIEIVSISSTARIIMGQSPTSDTYNDNGKGLPFYQGKADFGKLNPSVRMHCSQPLKTARANDILMSVRAPVGAVNIADTDCCIGRGLSAIRAGKDINYKYLYYWLIKNEQNIAALGTGSTFKAIGKSTLENLQIPLPPLATQKKIVALLDGAQSLIDKRKEQIALLDELIKSTFYTMFGDPVTNPMGWEKKKLNSVCDRITDGTHFSPKNLNAGVPYITAKHLSNSGLDFYSNPTFISEEAHKEIYSRCNPEKGDILYIKDGATTGIAAINQYEFEFSMLSSLALIKVNKLIINNYFLYQYLNNSVAKAFITKDMAGGAIKRLTVKKIKAIILPVPPLTLQSQFAEKVQSIEAQKARMQVGLEAMEELFGSLMQRAFSGEIE